jgi:ribosomal protein S18 acetylase RimI-like enzyme
MRIGDIPKVYEIGEQIFLPRDFPLLYRTWDQYEVAAMFATDPELSLVAEHNGKIVGFSLSAIIAKPKSPWKYGYLIWLGIARAYQRRRVGNRLFNEARRRMEANGARIMIVDTEGSNAAAIEFFRGRGLKIVRQHVWMSARLSGGHKP